MNRMLQNIGLCNKAGFLTKGFDPVKKELENRTGKIHGILAAADLSEKSLKEIRFLADKYGKPVLKIPVTMDEIETVLKKRVGIIAVSDEGLYRNFMIIQDYN